MLVSVIAVRSCAPRTVALCGSYGSVEAPHPQKRIGCKEQITASVRNKKSFLLFLLLVNFPILGLYLSPQLRFFFFLENIFYFQNYLVEKKRLCSNPRYTHTHTCVFLEACCITCTLRFLYFLKLRITHSGLFCIHNKNKALLYHILLRL